MGAYKFFMFDPDNGFETYKTAEEAKAAADEAIHYYREDACDGWPEEVEQVCWGEIKQETTQTGLRPREEDDPGSCEMICDYQLKDM